MFRNALEPWHLIILLTVFVLVFGANKLPDVARSVGQSMRILKKELGPQDESRKPEDIDRSV